MEHVYYEVETSLLAKPQALCDLIELEGGKPCIVFCNSPSDADFADVILRKRGVASTKLIGYVPQLKLSKAIQQLQKKEITTLVLTDVAARGIALDEFAVVVNYSVPTDPEVYFHRYSDSAETQTNKVLSLVSAVDISNFHYLKKLGKVEFVQAELPKADQIFVGKMAQLRDQAVEKGLINDASLVSMVDTILADEKARDITALLLHNTLSVIPALKAASAAREEAQEYDEEDEDDMPQPGAHDRRRGRDSRQGRDRGGDRGGDRGDRGDRDRDSRDGRGGRGRRHRGQDSYDHDGRDGYEARSDEDGQGRRGGRGRGGDGDRHRGGEPRGERPPRQPRRPVFVDKEARLYVGAGKKQGVSDSALTQDVINACGVQPSDVHRVSIRDCYSFVDVPESVAEQVIEKLGAQAVASSGEKYFVKKAVTLSIPREGTPEELAALGDASSDDAHNGSHIAHDGGADEEGPTMLALDE